MGFFDFLSSSEFYAAILQVIGSFVAVFLAVYAGLRKLRTTEIGRLRIQCVVELISYRWVLKKLPDNARSPDARATFMAALNAVPALFGDDSGVMEDFRYLVSQLQYDPNPALINLIQKLAVKADLPVEYVTGKDLIVALS